MQQHIVFCTESDYNKQQKGAPFPGSPVFIDFSEGFMNMREGEFS